MEQDQKDGKSILMPVEPSEAAEGAYEDSYHPLTKEEAEHKAWLSRLWLILLLSCMVSGLAYAGYRWVSSRNAEAMPSGKPPLRARSVHSCLDKALHLARQWHPDAQLVAIEVDVAYGIGGSSTIEYIFVSPAESVIEYIVGSNCQGQKVRVATKIDAGGIEFDPDMIDTEEAVLIGYNNGGRRYVGSKRNIIRMLFKRDDPEVAGSEVWIAHFGSIVQPPLRVVIDPFTGKVIRIE
jgi:hypothetical protein